MASLLRENALGFKGELAKSTATFFKSVWFGMSEVVDPSSFRRSIGLLHREFQSDEQQDAEEFIRWLLDGLHEDLNLVLNKAYYALPDSGGRPDSEVAAEHWTLHLRRNQSIVVDLFQGQYRSTLTCPLCDAQSVKFDAFSALTLPIPDKDTMLSVKCLVFPADWKKAPCRLTVNVSAKAVGMQLIHSLKEKLNSIGYLSGGHGDDDDGDGDHGDEEKFCWISMCFVFLENVCFDTIYILKSRDLTVLESKVS